MAHHVFICHSSRDEQIVRAACAALETHGIRCWTAPRDILPGVEYGKAIVDAISLCPIVLLIFSQMANDSPQVRREIERAVSKGKIIVPFRIEDVLPTDAMEYALSNTHWFDATHPPLEQRIGELCEVIARLLEQPSLVKARSQAMPRVGALSASDLKHAVEAEATGMAAWDGLGNCVGQSSYGSTHAALATPGNGLYGLPALESGYAAARTSPRALLAAALRSRRGWLLAAACAGCAAVIAWGAIREWQTHHYYRAPAQAQRWYDSGLAALHEGTYVKAERSLQQALQRDPNFPMAHVRLAEAMIDLDFQTDAQHELLAVSDDRSLVPLDALYFSAVRATVSGDYQEGIKLYTDILHQLSPGEKSAGYVDLGMEYERSGDIDGALKYYATAAKLEPSSPAPYLHTAVLQSRLTHYRAADQAFQRARELFTAELNQEGLAELDYEQGFAYDSENKPKQAKPLLQQSLNEAVAIDSPELRVRALNELSSANYVINPDDPQAEILAQQATRLAQDNRLDSWLAAGIVHQANAQITKHQYKQAESTAAEALQLSNRTGQLRVVAMADLTLASLLNQESRSDPAIVSQVIAPAQAALAYYQKQSYFTLAADSSLLIIRAQRDLRLYQQALQSGNTTLAVANQSGNRLLIMQSEETVGSINARVENYPQALTHYERAVSFADTDAAKGNEMVGYADALWQLGRYAESDTALAALPTSPEVQWDGTVERVASLLSRQRYKDAETAAGEAVAKYPGMDSDDKRELLWNRLIAQAHLGGGKAAIQQLQQVAAHSPSVDPAMRWPDQLAMAEAELATGLAQQGEQVATAAATYFGSSSRPESQFRSLCVAAAAFRKMQDDVNYRLFVKKAVDNLPELQQTWGPDAFRSYMTRPDVQALVSQTGIAVPAQGR